LVYDRQNAFLDLFVGWSSTAINGCRDYTGRDWKNNTSSLLFTDVGKILLQPGRQGRLIFRGSSDLFKYLVKFPLTIIKSKYCFLFELSLGATIISSVLLVVYGSIVDVNANGQHSLESIKRVTPFDTPQIIVGNRPADVQINQQTHKIYVANKASNSVSVIDTDSGNIKTIPVQVQPQSIAIDELLNKIYVTNTLSNTVSVINGYNDIKIKDIPVREHPLAIVWEQFGHTYVANALNNTVSVIDDTNDTILRNIPVGINPVKMVAALNKIYVANAGSNTVSVINATTNTKICDIPVGINPKYLMIDSQPGWVKSYKIYVANGNKSVSVINDTTDTNLRNIPVGTDPVEMVSSTGTGNKIFVAVYPRVFPGRVLVSVINDTNDTILRNITVGYTVTPHYYRGFSILTANGQVYIANGQDSNTVSVINPASLNNKTDIRVGFNPALMAYNINNHMIYVVNEGGNKSGINIPGTVSVINRTSDELATGVIFNVNPANSGSIWCENKEYPTNVYLYVTSGTKCIAKSNQGFEFSSWVENLSNNSTVPLNQSAIFDSPSEPLLNTLGIKPNDTSATFDVNRFGAFTANFKQPKPLSSDDMYKALGAAVAINGAILTVPGWLRTRKQHKHLKKCVKMIDDDVGKSRKNAIEDIIIGYYVKGKLIEAHRQLLKDKISEYYDSAKGSEGAPFTRK
jgi:YVTN family beta-propeller protein